MKQLRLLNIARTAKAQPRTVVLTRATRDEVLRFSVLGGTERGCGLFITKVEKGSKADVVGLKRGDQVWFASVWCHGNSLILVWRGFSTLLIYAYKVYFKYTTYSLYDLYDFHNK